MDLITFGKRIRKRREELGLSQNDLAMALKLPQGKVSMIEKGLRRIDAFTELPILAEKLGVSIRWLYGIEETRQETTLESVLRERFPSIGELSDEEFSHIKDLLGDLLKVYIERDPRLSKKISNG